MLLLFLNVTRDFVFVPICHCYSDFISHSCSLLLHSNHTGPLAVTRTSQTSMSLGAFSLAYNSLPSEICLACSDTSFRRLLKFYLISEDFYGLLVSLLIYDLLMLLMWGPWDEVLLSVLFIVLFLDLKQCLTHRICSINSWWSNFLALTEYWVYSRWQCLMSKS